MIILSNEDYKFLKNNTKTFIQQFLNTLKHLNYNLTLEDILNNEYFEEYINVVMDSMIYSQFSLPEESQDPQGLQQMLTNYVIQKNIISGQYDEDDSDLVSREVSQSSIKLNISYWYIHKFIIMMITSEFKKKYIIKPMEEQLKRMKKLLMDGNEMEQEYALPPELFQDESVFYVKMGELFKNYFHSLFKGLRVQSFIDAFHHQIFEQFSDFNIILPNDIEISELDRKKITFSDEISNLKVHQEIIKRQNDQRTRRLRDLGVTMGEPRKKRFGIF